MAIELRQTFQVRAPVDTVWAFMLNPANVVSCMPGASLTQVIDERSFVGSVKVKVGAVTAQYQGTITYVEADRAAGIVRMLAEGKERGGGTVRGTIVSQLTAIDGGVATSVETTSSIDLTGKIAQVGRGMIEGVSGQIIKMYVNNVRAMLEPAATAAAPAVAGAAVEAGPSVAPPPAPPPVRQESINIVAVVLRALWERLKAFFKRPPGRG